ncbi:outer membrane receptor for ferrienterochelin and colicins [Muriicola jejuensis]|uniref:TonB-dependent receptor n=2 Tax=Muriicola jejuensis TaxID=504488 RepID=A0A6P0U996_9FLAO|nr:TonB-dependent receptor [Muriicola jejuensis]NER09734.1 TonB-dependent receptor [Muriicola jejuensis]SMP06209.1 outer membrane receptor for ferrienterochelin and colicins [Muriicola jejuensis]
MLMMDAPIKWILIMFLGLFLGAPLQGQSQMASISGRVTSVSEPIPDVNIRIRGSRIGTSSDAEGQYRLEPLEKGTYEILASAIGFEPFAIKITLSENEHRVLDISLSPSVESLDDIVVSGTLKPVRRLASPVPVEVYSPAFLQKNPSPNVFEALANVNGVRPQVNCNVCNTGDIHINGLEGPYTLVLIDGMPIISGLGTVYGLSGIPNSLISQVEIVKGPASSLYGSEAVGGLINIITKHPPEAPELEADGYMTGWGEYNLDLGSKFALGDKTSLLLGLNYFNYDIPIDNNNDNFTDVTLQNRISVFQKWNFLRPKQRIFSLAGRYLYEDRWGGEMQWTPEFRGGDQIYGESIYTSRWELLGRYQLPVDTPFMLSFSYTSHDQNSVYGNTTYLADQRIGFGQLTWGPEWNAHDLLLGAAVRYNYYDDNTPATSNQFGNNPDEVWIPSLFAQDEIGLGEKHSLLLGSRLDLDQRHGVIFTPRFAYKWKVSDSDLFRLNAGTGFRVVNLFTEEHAALTGAREVVIREELDPERSYNININYSKKIYSSGGIYLNLDASLFYTYFTNRIIPDYETNTDQIIYDNLDGNSISKGISANMDLALPSGLKVLVGATLMDVSSTENGIKTRQILTEQFTGTWGITYEIRPLRLLLDYTGNIYGPMRLPLLGELDPRSEYSPTWSIQNIQLTYSGLDNFEIYGGVKNLLNWTPNRSAPFIIARADDPFDRNVAYNPDGQVVATPDNPYALTFDPTYVYGPNQGIRAFLGLRYRL